MISQTVEIYFIRCEILNFFCSISSSLIIFKLYIGFFKILKLSKGFREEYGSVYQNSYSKCEHYQ